MSNVYLEELWCLMALILFSAPWGTYPWYLSGPLGNILISAPLGHFVEQHSSDSGLQQEGACSYRRCLKVLNGDGDAGVVEGTGAVAWKSHLRPVCAPSLL
jgi:hypothetical protein